MTREKIFLQGQGKVREFHYKSGKIVVFEMKSSKSEILRVHIYCFLFIFIVF